MPIGPHIADFVSFSLRTVVSLLPINEGEEALRVRQERNSWFSDHDYKVIEVAGLDVDSDVKGILDRLDAEFAQG